MDRGKLTSLADSLIDLFRFLVRTPTFRTSSCILILCYSSIVQILWGLSLVHWFKYSYFGHDKIIIVVFQIYVMSQSCGHFLSFCTGFPHPPLGSPALLRLVCWKEGKGDGTWTGVYSCTLDTQHCSVYTCTQIARRKQTTSNPMSVLYLLGKRSGEAAFLKPKCSAQAYFWRKLKTMSRRLSFSDDGKNLCVHNVTRLW